MGPRNYGPVFLGFIVGSVKDDPPEREKVASDGL